MRTPLEVASLQGDLGRKSTGEAVHLHGVFALGDGRVMGGHVLGARVLLTFEATMVVGDGLAWQALPHKKPAPALRDRGMLLFSPAHVPTEEAP